MTGTTTFLQHTVQNFQTAVDKSKLSLQGIDIVILELSLEGGVYSGEMVMRNLSGTRINSNIAWLISPKIDMDTHTNELLTFQGSQHHLDIDSPLNALEVLVSTALTV
jgi:hypothetical protein